MWSANKKIRVMVVDDSILARTILTQGLGKSPRIEVVGTAFNPQDAMAKIRGKYGHESIGYGGPKDDI